MSQNQPYEIVPLDLSTNCIAARTETAPYKEYVPLVQAFLAANPEETISEKTILRQAQSWQRKGCPQLLFGSVV